MLTCSLSWKVMKHRNHFNCNKKNWRKLYIWVDNSMHLRCIKMVSSGIFSARRQIPLCFTSLIYSVDRWGIFFVRHAAEPRKLTVFAMQKFEEFSRILYREAKHKAKIAFWLPLIIMNFMLNRKRLWRSQQNSNRLILLQQNYTTHIKNSGNIAITACLFLE